MIGYADDTLILAEAGDPNVVTARANIQLGLVLNRIKRLGLTIAAQKTEVVCFAGRNRIERTPILEVEGTSVVAKRNMKYLGVMLDDKLNFGSHLDYSENKVGRITRSLIRLIPNLRGPEEKKRKLYANVILSVALYAAPVWGETVTRKRRNRERLNNLMRTTLLRVIVGYRTVALDAASLLARIPPLQFMVGMRRRTYLRIKDLKEAGEYDCKKENAIKNEETLMTYRQWEIYLGRSGISGKSYRGNCSTFLCMDGSEFWRLRV